MEGLEALFSLVRTGLDNFMMLSNHPMKPTSLKRPTKLLISMLLNKRKGTAELKFVIFLEKKSVWLDSRKPSDQCAILTNEQIKPYSRDQDETRRCQTSKDRHGTNPLFIPETNDTVVYCTAVSSSQTITQCALSGEKKPPKAVRRAQSVTILQLIRGYAGTRSPLHISFLSFPVPTRHGHGTARHGSSTHAPHSAAEGRQAFTDHSSQSTVPAGAKARVALSPSVLRASAVPVPARLTSVPNCRWDGMEEWFADSPRVSVPFSGPVPARPPAPRRCISRNGTSDVFTLGRRMQRHRRAAHGRTGT